MTDKQTKTILVPVTVTALIPIETSCKDITGEPVGSTGDEPIVDVTNNEEALNLIADLVQDQDVRDKLSDALDHLLSGFMLYKRNHPDTKGRFYLWMGVTPEQPIE